MKKIFILSTGIMFLLAILIVGGCKLGYGRGHNKVYIYLSSVEINGEKHLKLRDSNGNSATDSLTTIVHPGNKVIWKLDSQSGISKVGKIYGMGDQNIFNKNPHKILLKKAFRFIVPDAAEGKEEYGIDYTLVDNTEISRDPYLRVPEGS
jgi:hypothetical protein